MKRLGISTLQLLRRRAQAEPSRLPAVQIYRNRSGHLSDAGGAHLVLPFGLLTTLSGDRQQHLVDILTELAAANARWARTTTYHVLPWTQVRPGDLSDEELVWHGITSDIDPSTGGVAYSRGGSPLHPDTTVGHHPASDPIPAPAGTSPGARPALLPAGPGRNPPGTPSATSAGLRTERARRMIETHRRRQLLARHAPTADAQWAQAIIAADPLWGPDEDWKLLIDQTTTHASITAQLAAQDACKEGSPEPESPSPAPLNDSEPVNSDPNDDEAELAALEADLQDLYRP